MFVSIKTNNGLKNSTIFPHFLYRKLSVILKYRVSQKNRDLKQNGHNYLEIHQKGKKLVCLENSALNAAGYAPNLSKLVEKWLRKMNLKLATPL